MKKVFLKISLSKIFVELKAYFKKLLLKKGLQHRWFPAKFASFIKTVSLQDWISLLDFSYLEITIAYRKILLLYFVS